MDRISDTRKCMASLAIFKTLYDEKKDLYSVIASFSQQLICDQKLHGFSLQEFCYKIKEAYGFNLPIAVVKTSLKRLTFRPAFWYTLYDFFIDLSFYQRHTMNAPMEVRAI